MAWHEFIAKIHHNHFQATSILERNGIIPRFDKDSIQTLHRETETHELIIHVPCPCESFDYFPFERFLKAHRLVNSIDHDIRILWLEQDGLLHDHQIISPQNERVVLEQLRTRIKDLYQTFPESTDTLSSFEIDECLQLFEYFAVAASDLIGTVLEDENFCSRQLHFDDIPITFDLPHDSITRVWLKTYLDDSLNPYFRSDKCLLNHRYYYFYSNEVVDAQVTAWVDPAIAHEVKSWEQALVVMERDLQLDLPEEHCWSHFAPEELLTKKSSSSYRCEIFSRELYGIHHTPFFSINQQHPLFLRQVNSVLGIGCYTSSNFVCLYATNETGMMDSANGSATVRMNPSSIELNCKRKRRHDSTSSRCSQLIGPMHPYQIILMTTGLAINPQVLLPHFPNSSHLNENTSQPRVLSIGLAGGSLHAHFRRLFPQLYVESVEIDASAIEIFLRTFLGGKVSCGMRHLVKNNDFETDDLREDELVGDLRQQRLWTLKEMSESYLRKQVVRLQKQQSQHIFNGFTDMYDSLEDESSLDIDEATTDGAHRRNCSSYVVLANVFDYFSYLSDQQKRVSGIDMETNASHKDLYYDYIVADVFDNTVLSWNAEEYAGESNILVQPAIVAMTTIHELLRPRSGLAFFHIHKDGQFWDYVRNVLAVFGDNQVVWLESGAEAFIVGAKDVFLSSTAADISEETSDYHHLQLHPCENPLAFSQRVESFARLAGLPADYAGRYKYTLRCHWRQEMLSSEEVARRNQRTTTSTRSTISADQHQNQCDLQCAMTRTLELD